MQVDPVRSGSILQLTKNSFRARGNEIMLKVTKKPVIAFFSGLAIGIIVAFAIAPGYSESILAVTAVLSAIFAAATAYLNYESRPQLTKAIELHTQQHREFAQRFIDQFPSFSKASDYTDLQPYLSGTETPIHLPVEEESLFEDLVKHDSTKILQRWTQWKIDLDAFNRARTGVFEQIATKLTAQSELKAFKLCYTDTPTEPKQLTFLAVALIYEALMSEDNP